MVYQISTNYSHDFIILKKTRGYKLGVCNTFHNLQCPYLQKQPRIKRTKTSWKSNRYMLVLHYLMISTPHRIIEGDGTKGQDQIVVRINPRRPTNKSWCKPALEIWKWVHHPWGFYVLIIWEGLMGLIHVCPFIFDFLKKKKLITCII